ncbi:MAG: chemotaxis protein CheW, partial [Giesbergeria sp.]
MQTTHHGAGNTATPSLQLATFSQGTYWLGLDATLIHMAAPDGKVLAAASVQAPFSGMVQVQNKVYPVLDLRNVVNDQSTQSPAADAARQLIVVQVPL